MINEAANVIVQQMNAIEQLRTERDAAYARGHAAGRAEALEQAAGVCATRAASLSNATNKRWEAGDAVAAAQYEQQSELIYHLAALIRALAAAPAGDA